MYFLLDLIPGHACRKEAEADSECLEYLNAGQQAVRIHAS